MYIVDVWCQSKNLKYMKEASIEGHLKRIRDGAWSKWKRMNLILGKMMIAMADYKFKDR